MVVRSIQPDEFDAALDLLDRAFDNTPRDYFKRYFYGDPWFKPEYTRVCEDGGALVSLVQIVRREVRVGCSTLVMGGIANVGTPPEYRGLGYSSAAMRSSIEVMAADGMDFSMLFTGINPFYERFGWVTIPVVYGAARLKPRLRRLKLPYTVRCYREDDARAVVDIYNSFNSCLNLSVVRTADYWTGFAINPESEHFEVWTAEAGEEVVGYVVGHRFGKRYSAAEVGCRPGDEQSLLVLSRRLWSHAKGLGAAELTYHLPEADAVNSAIAEIAVPSEPRTYTHMMLRVIDIHSMFKRILPELERRSSGLKGRGRVTLATEFGSVTLDISPGRVALCRESANERVELTQQQLFDLIFGLKEPREVLPDGPLTDLLAVLFPSRPAIFYPTDGF